MSSPSSPSSRSSTSNKLLNAYVRTMLHFPHSDSNSCLIQQLGDSLGKGAFGQVYRALHLRVEGLGRAYLRRGYVGALNWATGETVAIKEITLSNIPKSEIGQIMVRLSAWCSPHGCHSLIVCSPRSTC